MVSTIPQLTLYSLYPGGNQVKGGQGSLNANSSFYLPATAYSPSYPVNISNTPNPMQSYLTLNSNQSLVSQSLSSMGNFNTPLSFNGTVAGGLSATPVPSNPSALINQLPSALQSALALDSISNTQFSALMAQPSFEIPWSNGLGLDVTTNGSGGVSTVQLAIEPQGLSPNPSQDSASFLEADRVAITTGAVFKVDQGPTPDNSTPETSINQPPNPTPPTPPVAISPAVTQSNASLNANLQSNNQANNPILQRLAQLLPQDNGISVSGFNATLSPAQTLALAANQSGFGVNTSASFQQNMAALASSANNNNATLTQVAALPAVPIDQLVMGKLPMMGSHGAHTTNHNPFSQSNNNNALNMGEMVMDATSRKSPGTKYTPFWLGNENTSQESASNGNSSPFSGEGNSGMSFGNGSNSGDNKFGNGAASFTGMGAGAQTTGGSSGGASQQQAQHRFFYRPLQFIA